MKTMCTNSKTGTIVLQTAVEMQNGHPKISWYSQ